MTEEHTDVEEILVERASSYGDYADLAATAQAIKYVLRSNKNWDAMPSTHKEALDMIVLKMVRVVNGEFSDKDTWMDIAGYANLAAGWRKP